MGHIVNTDVYGRDGSVVGKIFSQYSLRSADFEVAKLVFDPTYKGNETDRGGEASHVLTYAKTQIGFDRDIVGPVILMTSYFGSPVHVLSSGIITTSMPNEKLRPMHNGRCFIMVITPGAKPETVIEWAVQLPSSIRLDRKVIYIEKFDLYITAGSIDVLEEIRNKTLVPELVQAAPKSLIDVHIKANIDNVRSMFYSINGIIGQVEVDPSVELNGEITVRVNTADGPTILTEKIPNKELLSMEHPIYRLWPDFGGIELLIDYDRERLYRGYEDLQSTKSKVPPDAVGIITTLRGKIVSLEDKLRAKQTKVEELNSKLVSSSETLKQEEFKTKREEVRYVSASTDASASVVSDSLKTAAAIIGFGGLIIGVAMKISSVGVISKLVEWSIPMFGIPSLTNAVTGGSVISSIWQAAGAAIKVTAGKVFSFVISAASVCCSFVGNVVSSVSAALFNWW